MNIKKGSLSDCLLKSLEKTVDGLVLLEDMTYHSYKFTRGLVPGPNKSTLSEAIRRLREKGYIEKEVNDERRVVLRLTSLGQDYLRGSKEEVWDGKYRIVIWDIPESKRTVRNLFRRRLKDWGFRIWQRSVWVSQRNITSRLRELVTELNLDKWVTVFESDDPELVKKFTHS